MAGPCALRPTPQMLCIVVYWQNATIDLNKALEKNIKKKLKIRF